VKKSNILSISALQNSFEVLKKELNLTIQEVDKYTISFNQESGFLNESFQQVFFLILMELFLTKSQI